MKSHPVSSPTALLLTALALSACGARAETAESELAPEEVASTAQALMGDTSGCLSSAPMKRVFIPTNFVGTKQSIEDPNRRRSTCDAWDTRFDIEDAQLHQEALLGLTLPDGMPGNQAECEGVWKSEQIWVSRGPDMWLGKDNDTAAKWNGGLCSFPSDFTLLPRPFETPRVGSRLWFTKYGEPGAGWYNWYASFSNIDAIVQSFWFFWSVRSATWLCVMT